MWGVAVIGWGREGGGGDRLPSDRWGEGEGGGYRSPKKWRGTEANVVVFEFFKVLLVIKNCKFCISNL